MDRRKKTLTILIALMLAAVVGLCACMTQGITNEIEPLQTTSDKGYGIDDWNDSEQTNETNFGDVPAQTEQAGEESAEATSSATTPAPGSLNYQDYMNLSTSEQEAYAESFSSIGDYVMWFNTEKEKYDNENGNKDVIEVTGPIDLGELNKNK